MAILEVIEKKVGRTASFSREGGTFTRPYQVITDDQNIGPKAVGAALGINIGDRYETTNETYESAYCQSISPTCSTDCGKVWDVTVQYGPGQVQQQQDPEDPTTARPEISSGFTQVEKITYTDINGDPLVNSAGDIFNPPLKTPYSLVTVTITRNEASYSLSVADLYKDSVNSDVFMGADPGTVKLSNVTGQETWDANMKNSDGTKGGYYWRVTYEFTYDKDGHQLKVLSQGMREIGPDGELQPIMENGTAITEPVALDADGKRLAKDAQPYYVEADGFKTMAFGDLNLDPTAS